MTIRNTYAAESWDKVYNAFSQINFTAYDYDTVKESLLQYLKIYHAENFNDFIESSELIAILELFAYVAEIMAYRVDTMAHENFISTAQRKQSVLKLARLISYRASRNIPARGLVKINTVKTSESVFDSLGNNLANTTVTWNDANNSNWKEQFFLIMNKVMTSKFGQPSKAFQIDDVSMQLYTLNNNANSFRNGVYSFNAAGTAEQVQMELVPADIDENGPLERAPDLNSQFNIIYATDGKGDGSDYTGFLAFTKQGTLIRTDYQIPESTVNRRIEINTINVNDTDVWVYRVDDSDTIIENWSRVEALNEQNLYFNDISTSRKKYEIETLENDRIALIFGDGNFSDIPVGNFQLWTRTSVNQNLSIPKNRIVGQPLSFGYTATNSNLQECSITFSLTAAIQNNAPSESIENVRQAAPSTYYAQNRMVNGQDYNTFMLKDPTILRLKTINRTFAGQPKYIDWNDASGKYENIKLFGDDMSMFFETTADMVETKTNSKGLIDTFIEPLLQTNALLNSLNHVESSTDGAYGIISYPRRKFIEDNRQLYRDINGNFVNPYGKGLDGINLQVGDGSLNEKTVIQAALDQHWYGEPLSYVTIGGTRHAVISDPLLNPKDDSKLYTADLPRTIDGVNTYPPGDTGSGLQPITRQPSFGLRYNRFLSSFGNGTIALYDANNAGGTSYGLGDTTPAPAAGIDSFSHKVEVLTIELSSDLTTFTVISNVRGKLDNYSLSSGGRWSTQSSKNLPVDFEINSNSISFAAGDAFVIDIVYSADWTAKVRKFGSINAHKVNLNGWWELIPSDVIYAARSVGGSGISPTGGPNLVQQMNFDPNVVSDSWVFLVLRNDNNSTGEVDNWHIYNRNMKIITESLTTKFWYNQNSQIIDSQTKKPVFDKIRILRSNLDELGKPLTKADVYDVVGFVYDADGNINFHQLEVLPTDTINFTQAGDTTPDNILQFASFTSDAYEFFVIDITDQNNPTIKEWLPCDAYTYTSGYDIGEYDNNYGYDSGQLSTNDYGVFYFNPGTSISSNISAGIYQLGRRRKVPAPATLDAATGQFGCNVSSGLDFMWQHFSPSTHLIDPSVTNIHDAFMLTSGYYSNVMDYIKGFSDTLPAEPTPLELRTSYGYLLKNKMLSDTVVLHSGRIKLLFGSKADQRFRAKFKVVKSASATFSDERIKTEIVSVIDTFFNIQNWDFGDKFYATELISLIHQRLATQIASVVLVPTYSVNSFGSLFTIDSGFDEILQSAATLNDIEIVSELTPTVLRQTR